VFVKALAFLECDLFAIVSLIAYQFPAVCHDYWQLRSLVFGPRRLCERIDSVHHIHPLHLTRKQQCANNSITRTLT